MLLNKNTTILRRYDKDEFILTHIDPFEDLVNMISILKSRGYTKDILKTIHGISERKKLNKVTKHVSLYTQNAIEFIDQAFSGPNELSFVPLYYSILNFAKVQILFSHNSEYLENNKFHGASYKEITMKSRNILNEYVIIKNNGTIPLFYDSLTSKSFTAKDTKMELKSIYPYISGISVEFRTVFKKHTNVFATIVPIIEQVGNEDSYYLKIKPYGNSILPELRMLPALKKLKKKKIENKINYVSPIVNGDSLFAKEILCHRYLNRYLLNNVNLNSYQAFDKYCDTPITTKRVVLPEELLILLAFFHLSNVVRYNPLHLKKIQDSSSWIIFQALKKHAFFKFLKLF